MKKALLVLNDYGKALKASKQFVEMVKDSSSYDRVDILYVDPDCSELHPEPGVCFWIPDRELSAELARIREVILQNIAPVFAKLKVKPVVSVERGSSKDKVIAGYIQKNGPYALVVLANNNSKFCRQNNSKKKFVFKKQDVPSANVVCLL